MADEHQNGTIRTSIHRHHGETRVSFVGPADGYTVDDLDALSMAITHARRTLLEQLATTPKNTLPTLDLTHAFAEQQSRMAAPS
jgi:type VI protein secretion system component VasA